MPTIAVTPGYFTSICWAVLTASAGSLPPSVSTTLTLWPMMPPAALMAATATLTPGRMKFSPALACAPVKLLYTSNVRGELPDDVVPPPLVLLPPLLLLQAEVSIPTAMAATTIVPYRLRGRLVFVILSSLHLLYSCQCFPVAADAARSGRVP